jgi:hypothetical protein
MGDDGGDARWLTYADLAQLRGISRASAERLAHRKRWRRQAGNDGRARLLVPLTEIALPQAIAPSDIPDVCPDVSPDIPPDAGAGAAPDMAAAVSAIERAFREQLDREIGRADNLLAQLDVAREQLAQLRETRAALEARAAAHAVELAGKDALIATLQRGLDDARAERDEARSARHDEQRAGGVRTQLAGLIAAIEARLRRLRTG